MAAVVGLHVNAQNSGLSSEEMNELMEIIELQKRIKKSPDMDDRYDGIWVRYCIGVFLSDLLHSG